MKLTIPPAGRAPLLPLLALFIVVYLNIMNRCADGFCYTHGWPWVAYYGSSDVILAFGGSPEYPRIEWRPALADAAVAGIILLMAWAIHRRWRTAV